MSSQFNFGSVPSLSLPTSQAFSLGAPPGQPTATTSGFTFGTVTNPMSLPSGPTFTPTATPAPTLTLTLASSSAAVTQTSTQSNAFHGLGGTQTTSSESSADHTLKANKANKESPIPPEMLPLVEALKQFVKEQKVIREENSQQRFSIQPILDVGAQIEDSLRLDLQKIEVDIQRNSRAIDALKKDTNKLLASAEMAYRISRLDLTQTPSSYTMAQNKYINASTNQYFVEMIDNFELQMNNYSKQIQDLRTHIENMNKPYSSEELLQIMRKQHETLISLAAKVYAIHEDISQLKPSLRSQTKITETSTETTFSSSSPSNNRSFVGPNPFGLTGDERPSVGSLASSAALHSTQGLSSQSQTGFGPSVGPSFPPLTTSTATPFSQSTANASHSRSKRWTNS